MCHLGQKYVSEDNERVNVYQALVYIYNKRVTAQKLEK